MYPPLSQLHRSAVDTPVRHNNTEEIKKVEEQNEEEVEGKKNESSQSSGNAFSGNVQNISKSKKKICFFVDLLTFIIGSVVTDDAATLRVLQDLDSTKQSKLHQRMGSLEAIVQNLPKVTPMKSAESKADENKEKEEEAMESKADQNTSQSRRTSSGTRGRKGGRKVNKNK